MKAANPTALQGPSGHVTSETEGSRHENSELFVVSPEGPSPPAKATATDKKNKVKAGGQPISLDKMKAAEMLRPNLTFESNGKPYQPYMMAPDHTMDELRTMLEARSKKTKKTTNAIVAAASKDNSKPAAAGKKKMRPADVQMVDVMTNGKPVGIYQLGEKGVDMGQVGEKELFTDHVGEKGVAIDHVGEKGVVIDHVGEKGGVIGHVGE